MCSSDLDPVVKEGHDETKERTATAQNLIRQPQNTVPLVSEDKSLRFTQKSVPFVKSAMLPASIGNITLRVPGRHNLSTAAELISNASGIPVIMSPDALIDATAFMPGKINISGNNQKEPSSDEVVYSSLMAAGASRLALSDHVAQNTVELNYTGPLSGLLNQIAAKARLRWTFEDDRIVFRRVITRSIVVKSLPGTLKSNNNLSISSGGNNGGSLTVNSDTVFGTARFARERPVRPLCECVGRCLDHVLELSKTWLQHPGFGCLQRSHALET